MNLKNEKRATDGWFLKDGRSDYVIVLPEKADEYERMAAEEFNELLKAAAGTELKIVSEGEGVPARAVLVGRCEKTKKMGAFSRETGAEGFSVRTEGETIALAGEGRAAFFAADRFMAECFGYRYYAQNELFIEKKKDVPFYEMNIVERPDIEGRSLGFYYTYHTEVPENQKNTLRLGLSGNNYENWIAAGHTYFQILPKEIYFEKHPEWYSPDGCNLCLSDDAMAEEFIRNVKKLIEQKEGRYFMLGQEDNFSFCDCERCRKAVEKYGSESALMMRFANRVARETGEWLKKEHPGREVKFVTFAYNKTAKPPVRWDEKEKIYRPFDKEVLAAENLSVMVVPFGGIYNHDFFDEKYNAGVKTNFLGWHACCKDLSVWSYCVNFDNYMVEFNNYKTFAENYRIFVKLGVQYLFDQGPYTSPTPCFDELKIYMQSKLMWDSAQSERKLYEEFMENYYKDIAPHAKAYLEKMLARWNEISLTYGEQTRPGAADSSYYNLKHFWPRDFLYECLDIFREARGVLEALRVEDWDKYVVLRWRLNKMSLSVRFLLLNLYGNYYGSELPRKIEIFKNDMAACGIIKMNEGGFMELC